MGGGVRGILLHSSAILADGDEDAAGSPSLRPGADYLLRKLRHSKIPTGISYGLSLSDHKASFLERIAKLNSFDHFILNPSSTNDTLSKIALAWDDNGGNMLHVLSIDSEGLFPNLCNKGWLNIVLNVKGGDASKNSSSLSIDKLEELPLTICGLNRKSVGKDVTVVGYIMKPSREEDFAKRGAFPLKPNQYGLMFMPLTFELPIPSQLQEVDVVIHKATDEITSIELSNSSECSNKIVYTRGMLELQRFIDQQPDCCIIDPFNNIYPVVDRLKIQEILLCLDNLDTEVHAKIRGAHFLKVNSFDDPNLEQRLSVANLSQPSIVKPQVACGVADAHSMAIVFRVEDYMGLGVPLPAIVQEYVDHSSTIFKFYVLGNKVFYAVKKSTPNADILMKISQKNGFKPLLFDSLKSLPAAGGDQHFEEGNSNKVGEQQHINIGLVTEAANCLRRMLDLTIFGFDVVIQEGTGDHVIVDVNYLPSFKEVPDDIAIPAFWDAIKRKYESRQIHGHP